MSDRDIRLGKTFLVVFFAFIVIRNAWVSDDAYITFRTIENFLSGHGPNYNPGVRVQAYTHPLWMFLLAIVYRIEWRLFSYSTNALYYVAVFTSIVVSVLAVYWLISQVVRDDLWAAVFLMATVTLSRAFVDYSTSGLENPLTHLLLAFFVWIYFTRPNRLFLLTLTASLLFLNRQDIILLVAPAMLFALWDNRKEPGMWKAVLLGGLPVVAWELFSTLYYGFPFPNTAYAKLNTGIPDAILIQHGGSYLLNSLHWDPLTLVTIGYAGAVTFWGVGQEETWKLRFLYLGVLLYVLYVVKIGGDFMSGRFLTAPLLLSVVILVRSSLSQKTLLILAAVVALLGVFSMRSTLLDPLMPHIESDTVKWIENPLIVDRNGIADERMVYFDNEQDQLYLGLVVIGLGNTEVGSRFAGTNWDYTGTKRVFVERSIGRLGYFEGPNFLIGDYFALAEPLLARLPLDHKRWRIGHFYRDLPPGYLETLETGVNQIADPGVAEYYNELKVVIQGPLWSWERIIKIWKFNTGQYDHLLETYSEAVRIYE